MTILITATAVAALLAVFFLLRMFRGEVQRPTLALA
jgi:hypothetical protein